VVVAVVTAIVALIACAPVRPVNASPSAAPNSVATRTGVAVPTPSAVVTDATGAPVYLVEMGDHWFIPAKLSIPVGTTVEWRMVGTQEHDVWAFDGSFHSPTMGPGMRYSHTFTKIGTFKYLCIPHHGDGMYGEIVVVPRASGLSPRGVVALRSFLMRGPADSARSTSARRR
jgi:plastocyanin